MFQMVAKKKCIFEGALFRHEAVGSLWEAPKVGRLEATTGNPILKASVEENKGASFQFAPRLMKRFLGPQRNIESGLNPCLTTQMSHVLDVS